VIAVIATESPRSTHGSSTHDCYALGLEVVMTRAHIRAGLVTLMTVLALVVAISVAPQAQTKPELALKTAMDKELVDRDPKAAIEMYRKLVTSTDRAVAAQAWLHIAQCYEKLGAAQNDEARKAYEQLVSGFADQKDLVAQAQARLAALGGAAQTGTSQRRLWVLPQGRIPFGPSPDGRWVAFTVLANSSPFTKSDGSVWIHNFATGNDRNVFPAREDDPPDFVFSPDGRQIAYGADTANGFELRLVDVEGATRTRTLWRDPKAMTWAGTVSPNDLTTRMAQVVSWSQDGQRILVNLSGPNAESQRDTSVENVAVSVADGSARPLAPAGSGLGTPSPDWKYWTWWTPDSLTIGPLQGSRVLLFTKKSPNRNAGPRWSEDGRHIFFLSDRSGTMAWWAIPISDGKPDGEPEPLKGPVTGRDFLGSGRDGSVFYTTTTESRDIYIADVDPATGKVTSKPERYNQLFVGTQNGSPAWSADGEYVAYTAGPLAGSGGGTSTLIVKSARTGEERTVNIAPVRARHVQQWFPDGRSVLVDSQLAPGDATKSGPVSDRMMWCRIDIQTGKASTVFDPEGIQGVAAAVDLTPDGKALFYSYCETCRFGAPTQVPPHWRLVRRDLETGSERVLFEATNEWTPWPAKKVSADGRLLAFESRDKDTWMIRVMPADGGQVRELYRAKQETNLLSWTRDGRHLLLTQADPAAGQEQLLTLPVDGGTPALAGLTMGRLFGGSIHPDGRRLLIPGRTTQTELWVASNPLPAAKK
jgi:Tol biopolymer transport system component